MAFRTEQNALSTTAEQIFPANSGVTLREVHNADATIDIYVGNSSSVTAATGHRVKAAGGTFVFSGASAKLPVYAIAASGTPTVTLYEE